ncbi:probable G-protein coupled receptor CG31760, partial [Trichonephila clavata]
LVILPTAGPDIKYLFGFIRTQLSTTVTVILIFGPKFYRVIKGQGDVWDNRARARGVTASFSLNGVGPVYEEPQDLYQENEELKEEVQKLASQIEFMKIVHMEVNNRHLKPKHGGFFSQPTSNQSPVIKNIYMKFESTDSPGSRISPAAELVSEKNWFGAAQIYGVLLPKEMGEVILEFFELQIRGIRKALFGIEGTGACKRGKCCRRYTTVKPPFLLHD